MDFDITAAVILAAGCQTSYQPPAETVQRQSRVTMIQTGSWRRLNTSIKIEVESFKPNSSALYPKHRKPWPIINGCCYGENEQFDGESSACV